MGASPFRKGAHVGTSGWTYDDWNGPFYPKTVRGAERLSFYAERFDTVEVNATFYRFPTEAMVASWRRRLGRGFHLVVKGHRIVTHRKRGLDCADQIADFMGRLAELKTLRVILWQLPPSLHRDVARLEGFLAQLPRGKVRHAVEFRHPSWWDDDVARRLRAHRAAFVAVSRPDLPSDVVPTTDFLYLRFHGLGPDPYRHDYARPELEAWAARLAPLLRNRKLYAFFNNDHRAHAVGNAEAFRDILAVSARRAGPGGE